MSRYCFCLEAPENGVVETFAKETGRTVGSLAVVAIRQYMNRYGRGNGPSGKTSTDGVSRKQGTVRLPARTSKSTSAETGQPAETQGEGEGGSAQAG